YENKNMNKEETNYEDKNFIEDYMKNLADLHIKIVETADSSIESCFGISKVLRGENFEGVF
ncbi:MAG: hypothetical protein ACRCSK_00765, partial [Fusobacteriaceae bacterium]